MSEKVETIVVQTDNGPVIVNKEDAHKWEQKKDCPAKRKYTRRNKD